MKPVLLASHTEDAPMMKIDCPFCGPRDELEFKCGGQSHVQRPDLSASDGEWAEYLYVRENPKGWHFERRSEEHTSELQSLMRISYAVFCLKKKKRQRTTMNKSTDEHE